MVIVVAGEGEFLPAGVQEFCEIFFCSEGAVGKPALHLYQDLVGKEFSQIERSYRAERFVAVRAGGRFREHAGLLFAVGTGWALHHKTYPLNGPVCGLGSPGKHEVQAYEVLPGKAEERFNSPVVFHRLPEDKTKEDTEPHLGVVAGVRRACEVPADTSPEVRPAERGSIRCGYQKEPAAPPDSGIDKRRRRPERVDIDRVEGLLIEQRARVPAGDTDGKPGSYDVLLYQGDRLGVLVVDGDRDPALVCHPESPDTGCPHGIEVIGGFEYREEEDRGVPVDLHAPVEKDRGRAGRELFPVVLDRDKKRCCAFRCLDDVHCGRDVEARKTYTYSPAIGMSSGRVA